MLCIKRNLTFRSLVNHPQHHVPNFWYVQSLLSNGHTGLDLSHLWIQCMWNAWLHTPQAAMHCSEELLMLFGWHSMHGSIKWFLQMAHVSTTMSHDQNATAVHFFTSNLCFFFVSVSSTTASPGWLSISIWSSSFM